MPLNDWASLINAAALPVAVLGLIGGFLKWRDTALRRDEVLAWVNGVIAAQESLLLLCLLSEPELDRIEAERRREQIMFDSAVLVEQGRMFFRNKVIDDYGADRPAAYRGYRPMILDPVIVTHQICRDLADASPALRVRLSLVAEDVLKAFVSLAQEEVGRSRAVSANTTRKSAGARLPRLLAALDPERVVRAEAQVRVGAPGGSSAPGVSSNPQPR